MLVLDRQGLLNAMSKNNFSQAELARRTGLTARLIGKMLYQPTYFIRVKTLSRLRQTLNCSLYSLILGDWNRNEHKKIAAE